MCKDQFSFNFILDNSVKISTNQRLCLFLHRFVWVCDPWRPADRENGRQGESKRPRHWREFKVHLRHCGGRWPKHIWDYHGHADTRGDSPTEKGKLDMSKLFLPLLASALSLYDIGPLTYGTYSRSYSGLGKVIHRQTTTLTLRVPPL